MIKLYNKHEGHAFIALGLEPGNIERMKQNDPVFVRLREISPECPDYTISIGENLHLHPKNPVDDKKHISINFDTVVLDRMVKGKRDKKTGKITHPFKVVPLYQIDPNAPKIELMIFYTENQEQFYTELQEAGVGVKNFVDKRPSN